eukprot:CAMPEP_0194142808 /NCGR_PEP_ID=MMETSP0152-20130528/12018_1 /TAXON_ID=1049557 /ORGANISM="Thalassiothrix antarctica, Strain L6-D1" /LENGTH=206 /DNA_ID=CAMNT_0038841899 /DNA_START=125 /DNA_END=745 /DNA_ORIENTATION=+
MTDALKSPSLKETTGTNSVNPEQWPSISQVNSFLGPIIENESKIDDTNHSLMKIPRGKLLCQRSISSPDFRKLIVVNEVEIANSQSVTPAAPSFLEKLLSKSTNEEKEDIVEETPKPRMKTKPTFVVTPIRRSSLSSPNLCALAQLEDDKEDILGDSDAMEYYHQKSYGYNGRKNGLKIRPDEQKRLTSILHKKDMQRKAQGIIGK